MTQPKLSWDIVISKAAALGASTTARAKWRQRGIPPVWKIRISEALRSDGLRIGIGDIPTWPHSISRKEAA